MAESSSTASAVVTIVITGVCAVLGTVAGGVVKGYWDVKLAEQKFNSDLILKALEAPSPDDRINTLKLLVQTNLIRDPAVLQGVRDYAGNPANQKIVPQVKPSGERVFAAPVIDNARIYLLSGKGSDQSTFDDLRQKLAIAGFKIVGARILNDPGRPTTPEIRYFNSSDEAQANALADVMKAKTGNAEFSAKIYDDQSALPGYIEIWLGRS